MRSIRTASGLLATLATCVLGMACGDPELASELNDEGPPEVVQVNVLTESGIADPFAYLMLGESATFCRGGTEYQVNNFYCPEARDGTGAPIPGDRERDPAMDTVPYGPVQGFTDIWHVRVVFDELLDPDVEELRTADDGTITGHIENTQPVILRCGGEELEYDGFYDPSGNHLAFPPGPALVVRPNAFVASGTSDCSVEVRDSVVDKDGESVPSNQRGPYAFGIAAMAVLAGDTSPADDQEGVDPATTIDIPFSAPVDLASAEANITLTAGDDVIPVVVTYLLDPETGEVADDTVISLAPVDPLAPETTYTVTIESGITDIEGGALSLAEPLTFGFTTGDGAE